MAERRVTEPGQELFDMYDLAQALTASIEKPKKRKGGKSVSAALLEEPGADATVKADMPIDATVKGKAPKVRYKGSKPMKYSPPFTPYSDELGGRVDRALAPAMRADASMTVRGKAPSDAEASFYNMKPTPETTSVNLKDRKVSYKGSGPMTPSNRSLGEGLGDPRIGQVAMPGGLYMDDDGNVTYMNQRPDEEGLVDVGDAAEPKYKNKFLNWIEGNKDQFGELAMALAGSFAKPIVRYDFTGRPYFEESGAQKFVSSASEIMNRDIESGRMQKAVETGDYSGMDKEHALALMQLEEQKKQRISNREVADEQNAIQRLNAETAKTYRKGLIDIDQKQLENVMLLADLDAETKKYVSELHARGDYLTAFLLADANRVLETYRAKVANKMLAEEEKRLIQWQIIPGLEQALTTQADSDWYNAGAVTKRLAEQLDHARKLIGGPTAGVSLQDQGFWDPGHTFSTSYGTLGQSPTDLGTPGFDSTESAVGRAGKMADEQVAAVKGEASTEAQERARERARRLAELNSYYGE